MQWARSIRAAVGLLNSAREKTVIVTELALADGNWRDLVERVRCIGVLYSNCSCDFFQYGGTLVGRARMRHR